MMMREEILQKERKQAGPLASNMDSKTKYKMSSQMRLNEITRPNANITCDHHHRTSMYRPLSPGCHCHHMPQIQTAQIHPPSTSSLGDSSSCICSHHYHYIQHHRPNSPSRTSTPPLPPPLLPERIGCCQSTCEDNNDRQISGETHVAVTVHQHQHHTTSATPATQSSQSQHSLHHQYQALDDTTNDEHEECECCEVNPHHPGSGGDHLNGRSSSRLITASDEIIPSGSEDNTAILQRCCQHNHRKSHRNRLGDQLLNSKARAGSIQKRSRIDEENYSTGIEVYSDGADSGVKVTDGATSEEDQGPPLPPRPPPRPRNVPANFNLPHSTGIKKYVVWCLICGGFSCLLGVLFLGVYFLLHSYTITVGNFETVPTFVPATLLILTGLCIMSLARRRNRYSYLIKLSGACGLVSALTCALVTVTTTVLHMSRLQALRECEYAQKTRTCTCYSDMIESQVERVDKEGVRLVFDSLSDCGVVHGSLYSCLRAIFGLSVAGVLVAVFSCMLVYQLLSHERKKMYWEQLELRCRSLYTTSQQGPTANGPMPTAAPAGVIGGPRSNMCRCCEQCHAHRQALPPSAYPWDAGAEGRFWTGQPPGNFYSPNPGGDDLNATSGTSRGLNQGSQRARVAGWSWPRMPWQRSSPDPNSRYRQTPSSPDSQYGFSNNAPTGSDGVGVMTDERSGCTMAQQNQQAAFNAMANGLPYGVWGPPPPYSDPNSPARRGRYQYMHPHSNQCQNIMMERQLTGTAQSSHSQIQNIECHQHSSSTDSHSMEPFCSQQSNRNMIKRQSGPGGNVVFKTPKDTYENTPSDSDGPRDRFSNTLPVRKTKKRVVEAGAKSIGPNSHSTQRVNVQNVFMEHEYQEPNPVGGHHENMVPNSSGQPSSCQPKIKRLKTGGVENSGFQNNGENLPDSTEEGGIIRNGDPTESEVYFADVSSCCNVSVKNDNYYDDANQHRPSSKDKSTTNQPSDQPESNENEDYLAQRFGQRENSVRCRLPFPQQSRPEHDQLNLPVPARQTLLPKDISRQSMCSVDSEEKTDFTDLSPATPCTNFAHPSSHFPSSNSTGGGYANQTNDLNEAGARSNFVASFPFSSEQSQEAHRRSTKNIQDVVFLAPDAQYEVIKEPNQFENTPLTMATYDNEVSFKNPQPSHFQKTQHTPIKRPNITSIIQNLGNTDMGLLYPDNRRDAPSDASHQILSKVERQGNVTASDNEWSDSSDRRL